MKQIVLIFLLVRLAFSLSKIENCYEQQIVFEDLENQKPFLICQECKNGFIISYDFKECLNNRNFPYEFKFCKRLDRNGDCDESLCGLQIDQNKKFIVDNKYFDARCAKVDTINNNCIKPRFPYTLYIVNNSIRYKENYFCKIMDKEQCRENYGVFVGDRISDKYFIFPKFINPDKINPQSTFFQEIQNIKCIENYTFEQNHGCKPDLVQNLPRNCEVFLEIFGVQYCQKCTKHYLNQSHHESCDINCIVNEDNQTCKLCFVDSSGKLKKGIYCEKIQQETTLNCKMSDSITGKCFQCSDSHYLDKDKQCQIRILSSQGCDDLNLNFDQCLTIGQCQDGFKINDKLLSQFYQYAYLNNDQQTPLEFLQKSRNYINEFQYNYCQANQIINNDNQQCKTFLGDLCIECEKGKQIYYEKKSDQQQYSWICGKSQKINCEVVYENTCLKCIDQYFLDENGQCKKINVDNCKVYSNDLNICLECLSGYQYDQSSYQCVEVPEQCINYKLSVDSVEKYICIECSDDYKYQLVYDNTQRTYSCELTSQTKYTLCTHILDGVCQKCFEDKLKCKNRYFSK